MAALNDTRLRAISSTTSTEPPTVSPTKGGVDHTATNASVGIAGFFLFIAVFIVVVCIRKRCRNESTDTKSERSDEISDIFVQEDKFVRSTKQWIDMNEGVKAVIKGVLIDSRRLQLGEGIGKGQFGCVYAALLNRDTRRSNDYGNISHEKVAVKTLRGDNIDGSTVEAFLKEGLIMKDFTHRNVLTLIGVAIGDGGIPMIVLPYMAHGNLKGYICKPDLLITVRELLGFGLQVAEGMDYLAQHKFVHRDLALRNCMLDEDMVVKVADFGLSRDIYTKDYYTSQDRQAKLPVKWMALESLTKSVYTTKSDVWSFGVLIWELLTRGAMPYPDVSNWEIRNYIQTGRRMQQPETCPDEIYEIMLSCWREDPHSRPTFKELLDDLRDILHPKGYSVKAKDKDVVYVNLHLNVDVPASPDADISDSQPPLPYP